MKKLYLTSFTFTTETEEIHRQDRIVMVTSKEIEAFKATSIIDYEYDADLYTAQEKAKNWFKTNHPQSEIISIISHPTITGYMEEAILKHKSLIADQDEPSNFPNILVGYISCGISEFPPIDPNNEDISIDVVIDLTGDRKDFRVGYYIFPLIDGEGEWFTYDSEAVISKEMKWMDILPLASKDK